MTEWKYARRHPVTVRFREPCPNVEERDTYYVAELIETAEGTMKAIPGRDYVVEGVDGELYPIKISIFNKTYDIVEVEENAK